MHTWPYVFSPKWTESKKCGRHADGLKGPLSVRTEQEIGGEGTRFNQQEKRERKQPVQWGVLVFLSKHTHHRMSSHCHSQEFLTPVFIISLIKTPTHVAMSGLKIIIFHWCNEKEYLELAWRRPDPSDKGMVGSGPAPCFSGFIQPVFSDCVWHLCSSWAICGVPLE